ncbi:MAG: hypothetical protein JWR21_2842 [Herminiimonas sp.]|nr:hypothetical protein [Herminiimonas sp.]
MFAKGWNACIQLGRFRLQSGAAECPDICISRTKKAARRGGFLASRRRRGCPA